MGSEVGFWCNAVSQQPWSSVGLAGWPSAAHEHPAHCCEPGISLRGGSGSQNCPDWWALCVCTLRSVALNRTNRTRSFDLFVFLNNTHLSLKLRFTSKFTVVNYNGNAVFKNDLFLLQLHSLLRIFQTNSIWVDSKWLFPLFLASTSSHCIKELPVCTSLAANEEKLNEDSKIQFPPSWKAASLQWDTSSTSSLGQSMNIVVYL